MEFLRLFIILFILSPCYSFAANYNIASGTTSFNGATDCSGVCQPDDTLTILDRSNYLTITAINGTSGHEIIIQNPSDAKITITGGTGSPQYSNLRITSSSHFKLLGNNYGSETYGIKLSGGYRNLWIYKCSDFEVGYIEMADAGTIMGFSISSSTWTDSNSFEAVHIHHNWIYGSPGECVYIGETQVGDYPRFDTLEVNDNLIENCIADGLQISQVKTSGSVYNNIINNTGLTDAGGGGNAQIGMNLFKEINGLDVYSNIIKHSGRWGIYLESGSTNVDIHDNVIWDSGGTGIQVFTTSATNTIINNTIVTTDDDPVTGEGYGIKTLAGEEVIQYNLIIDTADGACDSDDGDCSATYNNRSSASIAGEYFTNSATGDFSLTYQSPAINDSDGTGSPSTTDFLGNTRPYPDTNPDPGAYEFGASEPDAPTPDPMTWATEPAAASTTSISMVGTTCTDYTSPVEYQFIVSAGTCGGDYGSGGTSQTWTSAGTPTEYTDSGLDVNQCYSYTAQARDSYGTPNVNTVTSSVDVYTLAAVPGVVTFTAVDDTTAEINAHDMNGNPTATPATTCALQVVTTSPSDANWQGKWVQSDSEPGASEAWMEDATIEGLDLGTGGTALKANTLYGIKSKCRNGDEIETALGAEGQFTTTGEYVPPPIVTGLGICAAGVKFE